MTGIDIDSAAWRAYLVVGRVQGGGFRWWTRRTAERLSLYGSVRNLTDGSVEVHVTGGIVDLGRFEEFLRHGPLGARVDVLEVIEPDPESPSHVFRIEP